MKQTGQPDDRPESGAQHDADRDDGAPRAGPNKTPAKGVAPEIARQIDENLKRLYQHQVAQDLPPELQALVARLKSGGAPGDPDGKEKP